VDRHEHVGDGHLGLEAFRLLLADERLSHAPLLLETPKADNMDPVNLASLRRAAGITN
jgi:deoxyribonuclease-4